MSVFIGSTTPSQRKCLSKEFKKLYAKKTFIPRKQKIAIALNTCDVGIKGFEVRTTMKSRYTPTQLAKKYKTTYEKVIVQLNKGIQIEGEHTKNKLVAKKIALDHLAEDLFYYQKLAKIERKFKK